MPRHKSKPANWKDMTPRDRCEWRLEAGTNKTGFIGVTEHANGTFTAKIYNREKGKSEHIGTARSAEAAAELYNMRAAQLYGQASAVNPARTAKPWKSAEQKLVTCRGLLREIVDFKGEFDESLRQRIAASMEKLINEGSI